MTRAQHVMVYRFYFLYLKQTYGIQVCPSKNRTNPEPIGVFLEKMGQNIPEPHGFSSCPHQTCYKLGYRDMPICHDIPDF